MQQARLLIGQGKRTREIAQQLHLSPKTVDAHRSHIKEKLGLKDSTALVCHAVRWVEARTKSGQSSAKGGERSGSLCHKLTLDMKTVLSISEIVSAQEIGRDTREVFATAEATYDEDKSLLMVDLDGFVEKVDSRSHTKRLRKDARRPRRQADQVHTECSDLLLRGWLARKSCSCSRTTSTGHEAWRTTFSVVLPKSKCLNPPCPWVEMTMRSEFSFLASSIIS